MKAPSSFHSKLATSRDGRQRLVNHQPDRSRRSRRSKTRRSCLKCGRIGVSGRSVSGFSCVNLEACSDRAKRKANRTIAREKQVIDGRRRKQEAQAAA